MAISQNEVLFTLIGTTYGGDGVQTYNLPDLQGRIPLHQGTSTTGENFTLGSRAGVESVVLNVNQLPSHSHVCVGADAGNATSPTGNVWAGTAAVKQFAASNAANSTLSGAAVGSAGQSQPHENRPPYLAVSFIIALFGVFPSRN